MPAGIKTTLNSSTLSVDILQFGAPQVSSKVDPSHISKSIQTALIHLETHGYKRHNTALLTDVGYPPWSTNYRPGSPSRGALLSLACLDSIVSANTVLWKGSQITVHLKDQYLSTVSPFYRDIHWIHVIAIKAALLPHLLLARFGSDLDHFKLHAEHSRL